MMENNIQDGTVRSATDAQADDNSENEMWITGQLIATNLKPYDCSQELVSKDNTIVITTQAQECNDGARIHVDISSEKTDTVQTSKELLANSKLDNGEPHQKQLPGASITDQIPASMLKHPLNDTEIRLNYAELERLKYVVGKQQKPPYCYASLIVIAIEMSKDKALTLREIRDQFPKMFPFFKSASPSWRESVRSALVKGKHFYRVESPDNNTSRWMIDYRNITSDIFRRQKHYAYSELYADTLHQELSIRPYIGVPSNRILKQQNGTTLSPSASIRENFSVFNIRDVENRTPSSKPSNSLPSICSNTNIALPDKFACQGTSRKTVSLRTNETDDFLGAKKTDDDARRKYHKTSNERCSTDNDLQNNQLPLCLINDNGAGAKRAVTAETPDAKRQKIVPSPKPMQVSDWLQWSTVDVPNKIPNPTRSDLPNYYSHWPTAFQHQLVPETVTSDGDMYMRYPLSRNTYQYGCLPSFTSQDLNDTYPYQYRYPAASISSQAFNDAGRYDYVAGAQGYGSHDTFIPKNTASHDSQTSYSYQHAGYNAANPLGQHQRSGCTQAPSRYSYGSCASSDYTTSETWSTNRRSLYQSPNAVQSPEPNNGLSNGKL